MLGRLSLDRFLGPAALLLLFASLGCQGEGGDFGISRVVFADELSAAGDPVGEAVFFPKNETSVYAVFYFENAPMPTVFESEWFYNGDKQTHLVAELFAPDGGSGSGHFSLVMGNNKTLPQGNYSLNVYGNNVLLANASFEVR